MKLTVRIASAVCVFGAAIALISCGKLNQDQTSTYSPGLKVAYIGQTYVLQSVTYQPGAGTNYYASQHPGYNVTLNITSDRAISGTIFCNSFTANVVWSGDNYLYPSNYALANNVCQGAPANPISFSQQKFSFSFESPGLLISDYAGTFRATFQLQQ